MTEELLCPNCGDPLKEEIGGTEHDEAMPMGYKPCNCEKDE